MYLLKLALRVWRVSPLNQVFSALAVGFLLLLMGFLIWLHQGLRPVVTRLQGEQVITAYLDQAVDQAGETKIVEKIRELLGKTSAEVNLVKANQFLDILKRQYPELGKELEGLGQDMTQVVPRYVSITGVLPSTFLERVQEISGVTFAESSKDRYIHVVGAFSALRWVVRILLLGVAFALFTGLVQFSRVNLNIHQDALVLLKHWGAGANILIVPGMLAGLLVGLLGGAIAGVGWLTVGSWLVQHVRGLSTILKGIPLVAPYLPVLLFLSGALSGMVAGAFANAADPKQWGNHLE